MGDSRPHHILRYHIIEVVSIRERMAQIDQGAHSSKYLSLSRKVSVTHYTYRDISA